MADRDSEASAAPVTVMVVHPRERRSKCTVEPLRSRHDFLFVRFPEQVPVSLEGYVRLGMGGPELSASDADSGLLVLDGTWKLASKMEPFYADLPVRSLPPVVTAYPRVSQLYDDPGGGLATIEAVYAAFRMLQRPTDGLLDEYYWKDRFLAANGWADEVESGSD